MKISFVLLAMAGLLAVAGCVSSKPVLDPADGWKDITLDKEMLSPLIKNDVQDYISNQLLPKHYFIGGVWYYADGTGRHAARIDVPLNGTYWWYYFVYNQDNQRIKFEKRKGGRYRS